MGAESSIAAQPCVRVVFLSGSGSDWVLMGRSILVPLMGRPAFPFIGQGKAWVTVEGKEETEKEKKSSRIVESFSFTRVLPTL